ncbi:hypothetical protein [Modicisalibacter tunisiensis]|uniref:Sulfotransferase family protein n=1 Tax=Modicisalibacter tunisiensis TaxID=390637 RepID=A0ABS7WXR5_9GAMM|nr:hypothetical protein [Modicisalibacter tunisiensis]MBZ9566661.1 hypothetical protein [Modicisalibacter tunisiensis]
MSERTVYLHIGFGKTGTTSIQKTLASNRELLSRNKILFPATGISDSGHHGLAKLGDGQMAKDTAKLYSQLVDEIESSDAHKIIISSENFCFMTEDYVKDVSKFLNAYNVKVIFYARHHLELIASTYLQWVKAASQPPYFDIEEFWRSHQNSFFFMSRIEPFIKHFGEDSLSCHLFHKKATENDVVKDFLGKTGIAGCQLQRLRTFENTSLIPELVDLANNVNLIQKNVAERETTIQSLIDFSQKFKAYSRQPLICGRLSEEILEFYKNSNVDFSNFFKTPLEREVFLQQHEHAT